ncbi:hypothetical protein ACFFX1_24320 [Dactylosporangium sucinum]|uniref:hypothetical protein n=1 Tax=Dactylosporangium sucinum TaxID=1424081 RepID=UPI0035EB83BD
MARRGAARPGVARPGVARPGVARPGVARPGVAARCGGPGVAAWGGCWRDVGAHM